MLGHEAEETRNSLSKVHKACKLLSWIMKAVFVFFCFWWIVAAALMCFSLFEQGTSSGTDGVSAVGVILFLAGSAVIAVILFTLIGIFTETARGQSPFMMIQVRRLRTISCMLLFYALLDSLISYNAALLHYDWTNPGSIMMSDPFVTISFAPLVAAAAVFAFSFVFKYGVLLQELSDETL